MIRLKSRSIVGAQLTAEYFWALGSRGAGTGTISSMVGVLLIINCYQLEMTDKGTLVNEGLKITTKYSTILRQTKGEILTAMYPRMLALKEARPQ